MLCYAVQIFYFSCFFLNFLLIFYIHLNAAPFGCLLDSALIRPLTASVAFSPLACTTAVIISLAKLKGEISIAC
jgi:hypothetical protein